MQGPDHEEFVKAARADNEIQFVEACSTEVAKILFPDIKAENLFLGLVKSEPEKFAKFGMLGDFRAIAPTTVMSFSDCLIQSLNSNVLS